MTDPHLNPLKNFNQDIPASIVVFLIALPLCLGIALASGAPLFSGIISGIIGGLVVGFISESSVGVSGPAAGMAIIVLNAISELHSYEVFLSTVVLCGLFQIILAFLRAGFIGYYFPSSVIKGMLAGIGIIIILKQLPHIVGYDDSHSGHYSYLDNQGQSTFLMIVKAMGYLSLGPIIISAVSFIILIVWELILSKKYSFTKMVPGPLVAVLIGSLLGQIFTNSDILQLKPAQLVSIPILENLESIKNSIIFPNFSHILDTDVLTTAFVLCLVGSIESLLCLEAADKLDPYKRVSSTNRELLAQGVGNITSGLIGGLPITQVVIRSSCNVQAGAQTKTSAILHGGWLLLSVLLIPNFLNMIPLSSLAAILILIGFKLTSPFKFYEMYTQGIAQFLPFVFTVIVMIFTDLLIGISTGLLIALAAILWNNYRHPFSIDPDTTHPEKGVTINLAEDVSFLNKAGMLKLFHDLPKNIQVTIDASKTKRMHPDIKEIIDDFMINSKMRDIKVNYKT